MGDTCSQSLVVEISLTGARPGKGTLRSHVSTGPSRSSTTDEYGMGMGWYGIVWVKDERMSQLRQRLEDIPTVLWCARAAWCLDIAFA